MRSMFLVFCVALCGGAEAQDPRYTFTVSPVSPIAGQEFQVIVSLRELSCVLLPDVINVLTLPGSVVQYELHMADTCFPYPRQDRSYSVPGLPAGSFTLRLATCLHADPPGPNEGCFAVAESDVVVIKASAGATEIPLTTSWGLGALSLGLLALGVSALRNPRKAHSRQT